jgi:hypothetical protein
MGAVFVASFRLIVSRQRSPDNKQIATPQKAAARNDIQLEVNE